MRYLFILLLSGAAGLGVLASTGQAQKTDAKQPEDREKILERLLKNVKQKEDANARLQAIMDLADFGPKAEPAIPELLDALQSKNEDLRLNAAITLAKIGQPAVKPVAALLTSDDIDAKFYAIWTLGWIGPDAKETVPTMIKLMADKNEGVRRKAAFALGRLAGDPDKTLSVLVDAFKDESDEVRQAAGDALAKFGKVAVPPLIELLKSDNPKAQHQASMALGEIGSEAKEAAPLMKALFLAQNCPNVQHYAQMLAKIGKAGLPALEAGFKDSRPGVRQSAAQAMTILGGDAVGVLIDGLGDKNVEVRRLAVQTLMPMRIGDKSVVIALAFALDDADDPVRHMAMNALQQLGPQAKLAGPKLKEVLTDMSPQIRQQAFALLQTIGDNPGPTLIKALDSKNPKVRINSACLMVTMGIETKAATPVLIEALENKDLGLKMQAAFTLAQGQLETEKLMPLFLEGLKHETPSVRVQAVQGLGMLRKAQDSVAPKLAEALRDPDPGVRQHILYALQNVPGSADKIVPILAKVYKTGDTPVRQAVFQITWRYGVSAKELVIDGMKDKEAAVRQQALQSVQNQRIDMAEFVPTIGDLLKDTDVNTRITASHVLRNMGPKALKAMPAIKASLKDENGTVKQNAVIMVATVGGEGTDFLIKQFQSEKDANARAGFLPSLAHSGHQKLVVPLLGMAMKDSAPQVRQNVVQLIGYFGQESKEGFEVFVMGLKDSDNQVRINAAHHGNYFGKKCWEPMEDALKSTKDANVRQAIMQNLQFSAYRSKSGVAPLIDCLKDDNTTVRHLACILLANIGPDAVDALPTLRKLADSGSNTGIPAAARNAMARIEAKK